MSKINSRGMALIPTLTISLVALLLGFSAMYISEMGYRSISAEAKWQMLEKAATSKIKEFGLDISRGTRACGESVIYTVDSIRVDVASTLAGGSCFIWSSATLGSSRVTKVGVMTQGVPNDYAAAVFRELDNLSIQSSASISSCDVNCPVSALITGNDLTKENLLSEAIVKEGCLNNPKGIVALVDPYQVSPNLLNADLTNTVFKNLQNRNDLLSKFTQLFNVKFNNGKPDGVNNPECTPNFNINNCNASGSKLTCECSGNSCRVDLTWNSSTGKYSGKIDNNNVSCGSIELGQNATITLSGFNGGGVIGANQIKLSGDINNTTNPPSLTLIARNETTDESNNINIKNVNIFSQNYTLNNSNFVVEGGVLYSGGAGNGNFNIDLNSGASLGTISNPVLIISDNNMNIQRNGNAEINGIVFLTSSNNNLNIGSGNGNFSINGTLVSNSTSNNSANISGNFSINFDRTVINNLANKFDFINPPKCGSQSIKVPFIQTIITVY